MKKFIYLFILLFIGNSFGQGLILTPADELSKYTEFPAESYGFAATKPSSYSLEKYVPPVLNQNGSTCVGFSTFYYGLSTMYNMKFNITDFNSKYAHSFDPYFIYSLYFAELDNCDNGLPFNDALESLKKIGAKKTMFPPFTSCNEEWEDYNFKSLVNYTTPYSVSQWYTVFTDKPDFNNNVKELIYAGFPVIVGVVMDDTMESYRSENPNGVKSDGLWTPNLSSKKDSGHALCVIGYDDYKFGGAFRIVNSWGSDYGDNGYMWVKYEDFKNYSKEAHVFELNDNIIDLPPTVIDTDNYQRFTYKTKANNYSSYEGQYSDDSISGYGIWNDKDYNTFYVGKFVNGDMDGFFLILDKDGLFSANAVNGELQDFEKLGFANNEVLLETNLRAKKFFNMFGSEFKLRKANSTKQSTSKPSKDE